MGPPHFLPNADTLLGRVGALPEAPLRPPFVSSQPRPPGCWLLSGCSLKAQGPPRIPRGGGASAPARVTPHPFSPSSSLLGDPKSWSASSVWTEPRPALSIHPLTGPSQTPAGRKVRRRVGLVEGLLAPPGRGCSGGCRSARSGATTCRGRGQLCKSCNRCLLVFLESS